MAHHPAEKPLTPEPWSRQQCPPTGTARQRHRAATTPARRREKQKDQNKQRTHRAARSGLFLFAPVSRPFSPPRAEELEADKPRPPDEDAGKIAPPAHPPRCPDQQQTAHRQQHRRPCPPAPTTCTEQPPAAHHLPCQISTAHNPKPKAQHTASPTHPPPTSAASTQPNSPKRPAPAQRRRGQILYSTLYRSTSIASS